MQSCTVFPIRTVSHWPTAAVLLQYHHQSASSQPQPLPPPPQAPGVAGSTYKYDLLVVSLADDPSGVVHSGAATVAVDLAEKANLPTVMTLMALGARLNGW